MITLELGVAGEVHVGGTHLGDEIGDGPADDAGFAQ